MHFSQIPGLHLKPDLYLQDEIIEYKNNFKLFGFTYDNKL